MGSGEWASAPSWCSLAGLGWGQQVAVASLVQRQLEPTLRGDAAQWRVQSSICDPLLVPAVVVHDGCFSGTSERR